MDDEGNEVEPGESGEMWSRGPNFCAGYFKNEAAAKAMGSRRLVSFW